MPTRRTDRSKAIRVAIVDDYRLVVDGIAAHLSGSDLGITVVIRAVNWAELVADPQFPAEVTVLDFNLKDGLNLKTRIQALRAAGSEVVVISRHSDNSSVTRAVQAGALGFVPKTDSAEDLVAAIRAAAKGEQFLADPLADAVALASDDRPPGLGAREQQAISLYATGRTIRQVAEEMLTTEETVKSYLKRARRKYRDAGIELGTRVLLRKHGVLEGWVDPD